jgi:ribonuclease HI
LRLISAQTYIISDDKENLTYECIDGVMHVVVYTDGSLYDKQSDNFCRAGWGVFVGKDHSLNQKGPIHSRRPTTFRAELRAAYHVLQHAACDVLIRSDCKGVVKLINNIKNNKGYDKKHEDADILEAIQNIYETIEGNKKIEWMPAHLDEPKNHKKLKAFLEAGGTHQMIEGNCGADELAKAGAEMHEYNKAYYELYIHRKQLTQAIQDMLVSIWMKEKERMFGDQNVQEAYEREIEEMHNIERNEFDAFNNDEQWEVPEGFGNNEDRFETTKAQPKTQASADDIPGIDANDNHINQYLKTTYSHYDQKWKGIQSDTAIKLMKPWEYSQQPVVKVKYKGKIGTIQKHQWEPYAWVFNNLQWSEKQGNEQTGITFIELAILAHIMTDGHTANENYAHMQTKLIKVAFNKFYGAQKASCPECNNYKE